MSLNIFYYSVLVSASISLIFCILLLIGIILIKDFYSLSYKLILYLCLTDMLTSIAFLLPNSSENICIAQAYLINFSILSSFLFTGVIMHYLKWSIVYEKQQSWQLELYYIVIAWMFPAILSVIPILTDSYDNAGEWCWIPEKKIINYVLQFFEGFGTALVIIVYNVHSLLAISRKLKKDTSNDMENEGIRKKLMKRMVYYPLIIGLCVLPAGINRVANIFNKEIKELEILAGVAQCLMGFGNCIVYGFTDNFKKRLKSKFTNLIEIRKDSY